MKKTARENLIEAADDLFYRHGFHAVGIDQILDQVGVTKTTFYNHFESKENLIEEVLKWHDRWWRDHFATKLREYGGDTPRGQLEAIFDVIEEMVQSEQFNGCIFVNVAVEFPLPHDPIHQLAAAHKEKMVDLLREICGYAGAADPLGLAKQLSILMEGAYVTQQVQANPEALEIPRNISHALIAQHLQAGGVTSAAG